ncbi:methylcobamide:CoM methyltransferase MtaA [Methanococcoides methylutens]|uniref:Methylcobalamin:coenzyme M methyltransferase, methanol-specific n=1 Tax=Methanococcoides methylutens MM1 TaxID=1434104 RepID=A0A0E3X0D5_METMT|nr:methylcobamide:CoM methyltransferase MtaA [Methanococcoides methylutens]AKB85190.1 Methylcobalamin:coenzyme M methyltransferase, methanol-specific [Methanococcoides methylutens MM1]
MTDLTQKERFMRALECKNVDKVPVCSVTQTGTIELMRLSGANWPEAHFDAEKMATLAIAAHELAGLEAVRYPFDGTGMAQTLGCKIIEGTYDTQPSIVDFPFKEAEDAENLTIPENLLECERVATLLEATDIVKERINEDIPVVAGILGPAGLAMSLIGARNYLMWFISKPDTIKQLITTCTDICIEYSNALFDHGADAVCLPDSEAGPDLIPPEFFEMMILDEYKRFNQKVTGKTIAHICGDASDILEPLSTSGFDGISIEEKVDVGYAKNIIGNKACLIGNISPVHTLLGMPPEKLKEQAKNCIDDGIDILAPGCGLAPHTSLANLKAFVDSRDEYYMEKGEL